MVVVVAAVVVVFLLLSFPIFMFKELRNAVSRGITIIAEAVIEPVIVRKNTGRHATKILQLLDYFPYIMLKDNKKSFCQDRTFEMQLQG